MFIIGADCHLATASFAIPETSVEMSKGPFQEQQWWRITRYWITRCALKSQWWVMTAADMREAKEARESSREPVSRRIDYFVQRFNKRELNPAGGPRPYC